MDLQKWKLAWSLAKNDFKSKYASSQLGVFWAFLRPVVMAGVYIFVFSVIARSGPVGGTYPYAFWLLPGLIVWFVFSDSVSSGASTLTEYSYLVKNVRFDITILPVVKVLSAFIIHTFFSVVVFDIYLLGAMPIKLNMIQFPYYYFATFCFSLSITRIVSAWHPFFKDLTQAIEIVLMIVMWACPVMWDISALPAKYHMFFKINPLYYLITGYRGCFMGGPWFWEMPIQTIGFWAVTAFLTWFGHYQFKRLSIHFADVL